MSPHRRDYEEDQGKHPNFSFKKARRQSDDTKTAKPSGRGRDLESRSSTSDDYDYIMEKDDRKNFVAKVYAILSGYLVFAFVVIFGVSYSEAAREFCRDYLWVAYIFSFLAAIFYLILICCSSVARSFPANFILLTLHNVLFTGFAAWIAAAFETDVVWLAFLATAIITVTISLIAKFAPCDVTGCGMFFCVAFLAMAVFSMVASIVLLIMRVHIPLLWTIFAGVMVALLSFYLMFVTQLILGGRRGEFGPDDVVLAVIVLFTTIMEIFIYLLMIIQGCGGDE